MKCLNLFSGTRSWSKVQRELGHEAFDLDNNPKCSMDIDIDILKWDYIRWSIENNIKPEDLRLITASPPCTPYSMCNCRKGDKEYIEEERKKGDMLVQRTLDIIDYFKPQYYCIENPAYGALRHRAVVQGLKSVVVCYCRYGYLRQKPTRLFNNIEALDDRKCLGRKEGGCQACYLDTETNRWKHRQTYGSNKKDERNSTYNDVLSLPPALCHTVMKLCEN